jgi:hypothetical protein
MAINISGSSPSFSDFKGGCLVNLGSKASTGTSVNFSGIPSWAKRITIVISGVQNVGTQLCLFLGTSGGIETTGYAGTGGYWNAGGSLQVLNGSYSSGFFLEGYSGPGNLRQGVSTLINVTGNTWVLGGNMSTSEVVSLSYHGGSKTLGGVLTQVQFGNYNGASFTLNGGSFNVYYE